MKVLITGGAGFIGSHVVRHFVKTYPKYHIYNLDALTYAGNLENLKDIESSLNYTFLKADIREAHQIQALFQEYKFDRVIHLAAESHVDRSIRNPLAFVNTNVTGTINLMQAALNIWNDLNNHLFYHVSTDEVYGSLGRQGYFTEESLYKPNSPYSASKASADHFVRAYGETYGLPFVISNCSNNYGSNQFPEKLIPLFINNIMENKLLPVYGDGANVRDWLYVLDHVSAIDRIFHKGKIQETYLVGGNNELTNLQLVKLLCDVMDKKLNRPEGSSEKLITFVKDRPGHDQRYAIDAKKLKSELGWTPKASFNKGLEKTVDWYLANKTWLANVTSGAYREYYTELYENR